MCTFVSQSHSTIWINVYFIVGAQRGSEKFLNPAAAQRAAQLLGINHEDLGKDIFSPPHGTGSRLSSLFASSPIPGAIPDLAPASSPLLPRANQGVEAIAAFVSGLYEHAFNALVQLINRSVHMCIMYMYVCLLIMYMCVCTHTYVYVCMYVCMYICMCTCMHTCVPSSRRVCVYTYAHHHTWYTLSHFTTMSHCHTVHNTLECMESQ